MGPFVCLFWFSFLFVNFFSCFLSFLFLRKGKKLINFGVRGGGKELRGTEEGETLTVYCMKSIFSMRKTQVTEGKI